MSTGDCLLAGHEARPMACIYKGQFTFYTEVNSQKRVSSMISTKSVLIVDDMKTIRMKLRQVCKHLGIINIYEAMDGAQAIEMLQGVTVDLVLSDWNMPNMTGIELVAKIRENPKMSQLPVIFITSENEKSAILKSLMSGVSDYIVKPFPDAIVRQKICNALKVPLPK